MSTLTLVLLGAASWTVQPAYRLQSAFAPPRAAAVASVAEEGAPPVKKLLADLQFLGPLRFIVQGSGAILESVAEVETVNYAEVGGGEMATVKTNDNEFEAHLRLNEISGVKMETKDKGDKQLYLIRFLNKKDEPALTCLLHQEGGEYDPSAIEFYEGLRRSFGDSFSA